VRPRVALTLFRILLFAALAQAADFSHRDHLSFGLECTSCHVSASKSTRAEDNNLPPREVCQGCHEAAFIKPPRATAVAHFNHSRHVPAIACVKCHHGIDQSTVTSKANFPVMADCMVCHAKFDMPESCWFCHSKSMQLRPSDHVEDFIDQHSRVKHTAAAKASCDVCHGPDFHCAGCH
jgi:Cytochrome c3